jgi:DNA modification methylase
MVYGKIAKGKHLEQDMIQCNTLNWSPGIEKKHPCPKPPILISNLIDKFSNEGDTVLDLFLGSGTTAVCAKVQGRKYIGFEINPEYIEISETRLAQEVLFGA